MTYRVSLIPPFAALLSLAACGGGSEADQSASTDGLIAVAAAAPIAAAVPAPVATSAVQSPATLASGFTAVQQWKGLLGELYIKSKADDHEIDLKTKGDTDLHVVRNQVGVGGQSGWHMHPGPSLITVTAGEITAYSGEDPSCTPLRYAAGQAFLDEGDAHVHMLRNEGAVQAETVAVQFLPAGANRRIDVANPGNCPF